MEKPEKEKKRSIKRKRKKDQTSSSSSRLQQHADTHTLFAVMLAALSSNLHKSKWVSIIKQCLDQLRLSLLSKTPKLIPSLLIPPGQTLPIPIISLLPILLNSKCAEIASSSTEIVGAASLFSFEMNEQIASDGEIVKGLISALASSNRSVSMAACNAVLDLSTTSFGRKQLLEFSAVENLMSRNLQDHWYLYLRRKMAVKLVH